MSVVWARVVGAGSVRRDFGHHLATNAAGAVLLAARLERIDGGVLEGDAEAVSGAGADTTPLDLTTGRLLKLAPGGGPAWSLLLRDAGLLCAPSVALDDAGAAYIAGPYAPDDAGLRGAREVALTKLGPDGAVEWTRPLLRVRYHEGRPCMPVVRVAADPAGGAGVTWRWLWALALVFVLIAGCQPPPQFFAPPLRVTMHKRARPAVSSQPRLGICTVARVGAPDTSYRHECRRCDLIAVRRQCRHDNGVGTPGGASDCGKCHWEETP